MPRLLIAAVLAGVAASALVATGERVARRWAARAPGALGPTLAWMLYASVVCIGSLTLAATRPEWRAADGDARAMAVAVWAIALLAGGRLLRARRRVVP